MLKDGRILVGKGRTECFILPSMANRHGLIAGATGTGKTITLKVMAESFSDLGVPVFLADVKGDLAGCVKPGDFSAIEKRVISLRTGRPGALIPFFLVGARREKP